MLGCATARTRKNLLDVEAPYVPGRALFQEIRSVLDSKRICTGPLASVGITTALAGICTWFEGVITQTVIIANPPSIKRFVRPVNCIWNLWLNRFVTFALVEVAGPCNVMKGALFKVACSAYPTK